MYIDCRGEPCPLPVIKTKKALDALAENDALVIQVDAAEAAENIIKMLDNRRIPYLLETREKEYVLIAKPNGGEIAADIPSDAASGVSTGDKFGIAMRSAPSGETPHHEASTATLSSAVTPSDSSTGVIVAIASDTMGEGDEKLGRMLLKAFINALTEADTLPKAIIFYNNGIRLTTGESGVLGDLRVLAERGVDLLTCGACLKHYGLTIQVGRVSNMFEIAELMLSHRIIKP